MPNVEGGEPRAQTPSNHLVLGMSQLRFTPVLLMFSSNNQVLTRCIKHMAQQLRTHLAEPLTPLGLQLLALADHHELQQLLEEQERLQQEVVTRGRAYGEKGVCVPVWICGLEHTIFPSGLVGSCTDHPEEQKMGKCQVHARGCLSLCTLHKGRACASAQNTTIKACNHTLPCGLLHCLYVTITTSYPCSSIDIAFPANFSIFSVLGSEPHSSSPVQRVRYELHPKPSPYIRSKLPHHMTDNSPIVLLLLLFCCFICRGCSNPPSAIFSSCSKGAICAPAWRYQISRH